MRVTVQFSKLLIPYTNIDSFEIEISSYREILSACTNLLPTLKQKFKSLNLANQLVLLDGDKLVQKYELDFKPTNTLMLLVPTVSGNQSSSFDSLGNLNLFYGSSGAVSSTTAELTGLHKRIIDSSLYGKAQIAFDIAQRKTNRDSGVLDNAEDPTRGFGSLATMAPIGSSIPLHFGIVRTSGALISQYIKHIQRGGEDNIRVADYL